MGILLNSVQLLFVLSLVRLVNSGSPLRSSPYQSVCSIAFALFCLVASLLSLLVEWLSLLPFPIYSLQPPDLAVRTITSDPDVERTPFLPFLFIHCNQTHLLMNETELTDYSIL